MEYYKYYNIIITHGIKCFADENKCWWLVDMVWSYWLELVTFPFLVITFENNIFEVREDLPGKVLIAQKVKNTDLNITAKFYFSDLVLMLPEEY